MVEQGTLLQRLYNLQQSRIAIINDLNSLKTAYEDGKNELTKVEGAIELCSSLLEQYTPCNEQSPEEKQIVEAECKEEVPVPA